MFFELRGAEAITFVDIHAYEAVRGIKLLPIEVDAILAMDRAASAVVAEVMKESV